MPLPDQLTAILDAEALRLDTIAAGDQSALLGTRVQNAMQWLEDVLWSMALSEPHKVWADEDGVRLLRFRHHLQGANPTHIDLTAVASAATRISTATEPFALANADTLIVNTDGNGDETATFTGTVATSTSAGSPETNMSPTPACFTGGAGGLTSTAPTTGTSGGATDPALQNATPTAATSTSDASPATDMSSVAGVSIGAASPALTDATPTAGTSTSGASPATDMSSVAGISVSAASPATDMSSMPGTSASAATAVTGLQCGEDTKFTVDCDGHGGAPHVVTCVWAGCNTVALTAAQMQTQIQAEGAPFNGVTVVHNGTGYVFTSGTVGDASAVVLTTSGDANDVADDLSLGVANGGVETAGHAHHTKFRIQPDVHPDAHQITCDFTTCSSGTLVAAEMQSKIQAEGGDFAAITVAYSGGLYTVTSGTVGDASAIVITNGDAPNCADDLKIGVANSGVETAGHQHHTKITISVDAHAPAHEVTCDFATCTTGALIATELQTKIQAEGAPFAATTVAYTGGLFVVTSGTTGKASSVVITDGGAPNAADDLKLGVANGGTEAVGLWEDKIKFNIDAAGATEVTPDWATGGGSGVCNTPAKVAAELQRVIRLVAAGGYTLATCTWDAGTSKYTVTSGTVGGLSSVVVTAGASDDCADQLKLGIANGGSETGGHQHDTKLKIAGDGAGATEITMDFTSASSGALIAAELQVKIRAIGAGYATYTAVYSGGLYVITSQVTGKTSAVVITNGDTVNCADDLKLGAANGGTEVVGNWHDKIKVNINAAGASEVTPDWATGNGLGVCNTGAKIAAELQRVIRAVGSGGYTLATVTWNAGGVPQYRINSGTTGTGSSVVVTAGTTDDCAHSLGLGVANAGTEVAGVTYAQQLKVTVDDTVATDVTFAWDGTCITGAAIATFMQTALQNVGGDFATVTCTFGGTNQYTITSGQKNATSLLVCADATADSCADLLNLAVAYAGVAVGRITRAGNLKLAVDGNTAHTVSMADWLTATSGANTATWMQTKIQAEAGEFAALTVAYSGGLYVLTSGISGTDSHVIVTAATSDDAAPSVKLGAANSGVEVAGTGNVANIGATTALEVVDVLNLAYDHCQATVYDTTHVAITSPITGRDSVMVVNATCTADTKLGITGTDYGQDGVPVAGTMDDDDYLVAVQVHSDTPATKNCSVTSLAASGFDIYCETAACVDAISVWVCGKFTPT